MEHIDPLLYGLFLLASAILVFTPGPIVSLTISETLSNGPKNGFGVVVGAATVAILFLAINYWGFTAIQTASSELLNAMRYAGAIYLLYLAYSAFTSPPKNLELGEKQQKTTGASYRGSLLVAASNPKAILFFAAFFPQFVSTNLPLHPQLLVLSVSFIAVTLLLDCVWVFAAAKARGILLAKGNHQMIDKISGSVLGLAAVALLFLNT
ncbi:MAG: LysE family translocator [Kordiimonadaceae bacterium]|nr:LysE family translocator [Kordiimonadaceae bacterium]